MTYILKPLKVVCLTSLCALSLSQIPVDAEAVESRRSFRPEARTEFQYISESCDPSTFRSPFYRSTAMNWIRNIIAIKGNVTQYRSNAMCDFVMGGCLGTNFTEEALSEGMCQDMEVKCQYNPTGANTGSFRWVCLNE